MSGPAARPVRDGGSIRRLVVALVLSSPPDPAGLQEALSSYDALRARYPRQRQQRAATVSLGLAQAVVDPAESGELAGFSFDYLEPDGNVKQALSCTEKVLNILRTDCSDPSQIIEDAHEEFRQVLPPLGRDVNNLVVERLDRFAWDGAHRDFRAACIFREGSGWLTPNIFAAQDMWHTNHGLFEYTMDPYPHRLLHVIEVNALPASEASPPESGTTIVADVKQQLNVIHGMSGPGQGNRAMSPDELLDGAGLLRSYAQHGFQCAERALADILNEVLLEQTGLGAAA